MKINFINPETKKKLFIECDKKLLVIYGKNGSGKTTFSRSEDLKEALVFNVDFVNKNVYSTSVEGTKIDPKNRENFSSIWIGTEIVDLKKEINDIEILHKNTTSNLEKHIQDEIGSLFNKNGLYFDRNDLSRIKKIKHEINSFDFDNEYKNFVYENQLKTNITDDQIFELNLKQFKNDEIKEKLTQKINDSHFIKELFFNKNLNVLTEIDDKVIVLEKTKNEIINLEKSFKSKDPVALKSWVEEGIKLHENERNCRFCDSNIKTEEIKNKWLKVLNNDIAKSKNVALDFLKGKNKEIQGILSNELYSTIAPDFINKLKKLSELIDSIKNKILSNDFTNIPMLRNENLVLTIDFSIQESVEMLQNIQNYLFNKIAKKYVFFMLFIDKLKIDIKNREEILDNTMKSKGENIAKEINESLKELGFYKELSLKVNKRGKERTFEIENIIINNLSEGQKHKIALAIFLSYIKNQGIQSKVIVFDDPIVTLDSRCYYAFRQKTININKEKPELLVVLTHNIQYLYIQLSNLFNRPEEVDVFKIDGDVIDKLDISILNCDDLVLYKRALNILDNKYELYLLAKLSIRIFRYFLDISLRIRGISSNQNPNIEFNLLNLNDTNKTLIKKENELIYKTRNPNLTYKECLDSIISLKNCVKILGLPEYITDEDIERLTPFSCDQIVDNNDKYIQKIEFDIISSAISILENENVKSDSLVAAFKNYIEHPRNQLTKNILSIGLEDNDFKVEIK